MDQDLDLEIKPTYDWCIRAFSLVQDRLGLNIRFHHDEGQVEAGQIFLFNHFARFETIVPQYLIHRDSERPYFPTSITSGSLKLHEKSYLALSLRESSRQHVIGPDLVENVWIKDTAGIIHVFRTGDF